MIRRPIKLRFIVALGLFVIAITSVQAQQVCETYIPNDVPNNRYIVHDDLTVTDTLTGLMWARCTQGRSGADCSSDEDQTYNWSEALLEAEESVHAEYDDWRVPSVEEYRSLVNYSCRNPAINLTIFPNTEPGNNYFWSSEIHLKSGDDISKWFDFYEGNQNAYFRTGSAKLRLVREITN